MGGKAKAVCERKELGVKCQKFCSVGMESQTRGPEAGEKY